MFTFGVVIRKTVIHPFNSFKRNNAINDCHQLTPGLKRHYSSINFFKYIAEDVYQASKLWTTDFLKRRKLVLGSLAFCATSYLVYRINKRNDFEYGESEPIIEEPQHRSVFYQDAPYTITAPFKKIGFFFASCLSLIRDSRDRWVNLGHYDSTMSKREYNAIINDEPEKLKVNVLNDKQTWRALIPPSAYKQHLTVMIEADLLFDVVNDRNGYFMKKRPYADLLIKTMGNYAEIIVASSFHSKEASKHFYKLFDPDDITSYHFSREDMRIWHGRFVKPMEEAHSGRKPSRLVLLDNNLSECGPMCENVLQLKSWHGNMKDTSLKDILPMLLYMSAYVQNGGDVRDLTKQFVGVKDVAAKVTEIMIHGKEEEIESRDGIVPRKLEVLDSIANGVSEV